MAVDHYGNPQPAPLLGRYQIEQIIAQSGLGVRYKAFDPQLNRPIAVETLEPRYIGDPAAMHGIEKRFNREIEAGARVGNHPHLVQVYDLLHDERHLPYLLLEYVPGGSVADRLAYGPLPVPDALRIAADAARGLEAAQSVGLVHRDIAPAHIYLMTDGRAKVGDFGNAQIDDLASETVTDVATPVASLYTSPEQGATNEYVPAASDQYSLGLVLFEMLIGTPYKRMNAQDARAWLGQWPAIAPVIERLTADHPANRYASMRDVVIAIENIAAAAPPGPAQYWQPQPAPPPVASAPPKRTHRRAVLFGLGGLVVAGAAGGGGYYLYEHRGGGDAVAGNTRPANAGRRDRPDRTGGSPDGCHHPTAIPHRRPHRDGPAAADLLAQGGCGRHDRRESMEHHQCRRFDAHAGEQDVHGACPETLRSERTLVLGRLEPEERHADAGIRRRGGDAIDRRSARGERRHPLPLQRRLRDR